jgi:hypothetical protein
MRSWQRVTLSLCATVIVAGCAAQQEARDLASRLRKLSAEYASVSTAKIAAEKQFYLDSLRNLDQTLNVVDPNPTAASPPDIRKTVAYGRIITNANSDSQRLAEALIRGSEVPMPAAAISDFVRDGVKAEEQAFLQVRQMQAAINESLVIDFANLEQYQRKLSELSRQLTELEKATTSAARLSQLRAIGNAVRDQLKADKDASK